MANGIDTTSSYISAYNLNNTNLNQLDQVSSKSKVDNVNTNSENFSNVDGLDIQQRALSQSLKNSTGGIALANIAQKGLVDQKNILLDIKELMNQTSDSKLDIENEINIRLQKYEAIANDTNYNKELLLKTTGEDSSDDISIVIEDEIISMHKADTTSTSNDIRNLLNNFSTSGFKADDMVTILDEGIKKIESFESRFKTALDSLESSGKTQLSEASKDSDTKSTIAKIDYPKEITDFTKSNLLSQAGYLMQTQANAHQQRTIDILK